MLDRELAAKDVEALCYGNALKAFGQSGQHEESTGSIRAPVDQRMLFEGQFGIARGRTPRGRRGSRRSRSAWIRLPSNKHLPTVKSDEPRTGQAW